MTAETTSSRNALQRWGWVLAGLSIAALVVIFLAPAASSDPDGLDRVSEDKEFVDKAEEPRYEWLPDYTVPGIDNEWASVVLAGLIGVGIVFVITLGLGAAARTARRRRA